MRTNIFGNDSPSLICNRLHDLNPKFSDMGTPSPVASPDEEVTSPNISACYPRLQIFLHDLDLPFTVVLNGGHGASNIGKSTCGIMIARSDSHPQADTIEWAVGDFMGWHKTGSNLSISGTDSPNRTIRALVHAIQGLKYKSLRTRFHFTYCPLSDAEHRPPRTAPRLTMPSSPAANGTRRRQVGNARGVNRRKKSKEESAQAQLFSGPLTSTNDQPGS